MVINKNKSFLFFVILLMVNCGGSSSSENTVEASESDIINTAKLVGTPFEGLESGDDFSYYYFLCDEFKTETIDSLPIYVFAAFFTDTEEEIIQEGIDIANEAAGMELYRLTDIWSNDVRVIYKVTQINNAIGKVNSTNIYYNSNYFSENIASDWAMLIKQSRVSKWLIAHELGHATGISSHALIDYENDTIIDLETNSLMEPDLPSSPILNDYNYMMNMQSQIMQDHLGEIGELWIDWCE